MRAFTKAPVHLSIIILIIFCFSIESYSQKINVLTTETTGFEIIGRQKEVLKFKSSISEINFKKVFTKQGYFSELLISGYNKDNNVGFPAIPVLRKMVEIPLNATVKINITSKTEREYYLPDYGVNFQLMPAQPSLSKSDNASDAKFEYNAAIYSRNEYLTQDIVSFNNRGIMRGSHLGLLSFRPVNYNPVSKKINVITAIEFEVVVENGDYEATEVLKSKTNSPYFSSLYNSFIVNATPEEKSNLTQYPVKFVIVSDPMFQTALQPFVEWKTKKGFTVVEAYTNNPLVGTTTTSIKGYLQNLYNSATPTDPAFSFVLFVGDVAQIPAFAGTTGSHLSDFYYCEYTGDMLPEAYYGRFSANNVLELQPQIDKTLEYEKYLMPSPLFLDQAVLVAGVDGSMAPTYGNGQVNYINDTYINTGSGFLPHIYLYPASGSSASQIIQNVSEGVGFANYTAHCSAAGWADPSFSTSDVNGLQNNGKYPFMIGNCCSSNDFSVNACFGEALLRAANKGSIGYIGGSNSTYWDEDYWYAVGNKAVILNPLYDAANLGAVDRSFHTHGEAFSEWFVTQGQINIAGNLAVEQSASTSANYYWEIYHLMGDPSLMPYFKVPPALTITYNPIIPVGSTTFVITTEPYTYVAMSQNGVLHGAGLTDASGIITLTIAAFTTPGTVDIVATKQNRQPHISTINAITPNGPYIVHDSHAIVDIAGNNNSLADYGESITLNVILENVGNQTANAVNAKLKTSSTYVSITDSLQTFGNISASATSTQNNAYSLTINALIPDQQTVPFTLTIKDVNDSTWTSNFSIVLNAPEFKINPFILEDLGNSNLILDPNELANVKIPTQNIGQATAINASGTLQSLSSYIVVNTSSVNLGNINFNQTVDAVFSIKADTLCPTGTPVQLVYTVNAVPYQKVDTLTIVIGEIPEINMKDTTLSTCYAHFYDTGGPVNDYTDDETHVITFLPTEANHFVKAVFSAFDVEENTASSSCWDELKVYDGSNTSAPLIGTYCGTSIPGPFIATNVNGSLTFSFTSDGSVQRAGWVAEITCYSTVNIDNVLPSDFNCKVYPNPSTGLFTLEINYDSKENSDLTITTIEGAVVYKKNISYSGGHNQKLDLTGFAKGIYILKLNNSEKQITKKLFVY